MNHSHGAADTGLVSQIDIEATAKVTFTTRGGMPSWIASKMRLGILAIYGRVQIVLFDSGQGLTRSSFRAGGSKLLVGTGRKSTSAAIYVRDGVVNEVRSTHSSLLATIDMTRIKACHSGLPPWSLCISVLTPG